MKNLLLAMLVSFLVPDASSAAPPNVLIILADDCTFSDLPLYGGKIARTPNIDRLASQGLTFNRSYQLVKRYMHRPAEEIYHTTADPAEMTNLAGQPEHASVQNKLSAELDRWLAAQNDPGVPLDTDEAHSAAKRGQPIFPSKP